VPDLDKITKLVMEVIRRAALVDDARKAGDPIRALREARGLEVAAHDVATALHNELKKT
jgi:hypothetical protein